MRAVVPLLAALLAAAPPAGAEVDVQLKAGRVDVRVTAAPLTEVLDRLARATGMKIVQQGTTPSMLLSLHLSDRTPAEAVFGVLEGLGLNYAFVLDATGTRIDTLVLAGASGAKPTPTSAPAAPVAPPRYVPQPQAPPPGSGPDASDDEGEDVPIDEGEDTGEDDGEAEAAAAEAAGKQAGPAGPRGNVLQTPSQSVFPTSPFAPRAPMFVPQPEPQATPQPGPTPPPRQP